MAGVTLNPDEINALMSAIQEGRVASETPKGRGAAVPYDLTSQDRVIRGQMPTLDAINEQVASGFAIGLVGRTRLAIRVTTGPASLLKFGDFNSLLAPPATVCVLNMGKSGSQALLVLEPGLADKMIAAALGDKRASSDESSASAPPSSDARRELTSVERNVLRRLLSMFTDAMTTAWAPVLPFRPECSRFESDPRLAVIAPSSDAAVLCSFELDGSIRGVLQLAIPYTAIEPAKKALMSPPKMHAAGDSRFVTQLTDELTQVNVEMRVLLGKTCLTVERLLDLELGDTLTLCTSEGAPLPVFVEGRPKMTGQPKVIGGALALELDDGPQAELRRPFDQEPKKKPPDNVVSLNRAA